MNLPRLFNKISSLFSGNGRLGRTLELQPHIIEELTVTSDLPAKWRERVKNVLLHAGGITDIRFCIATFCPNNARPSIEILWPCTPQQNEMSAAEEMVKEKILSEAPFSLCDDKDIKHVYLSADPAPGIVGNGMEIQIRWFSSDILGTKGAIGLGLSKDRIRDRADMLMTEGLLASIANIVCSSAALTAYTREIERFATRDPLTALYNQVAFWDLLEYESERSKRQNYSFSLILMDIDNFKAVNDMYGHDVGDAFLKEMGSLVRSAVRKGDIPARYGGDKFAAILPVCDEEQAYSTAQRVMEGVRGFSLALGDGTVIRQTVSAGIAVFPRHAGRAKDLLVVAENALSEAKSTGKDRVCLPGDKDTLLQLKTLGEKNILVINAISNRRIVPYFQPIVDVKNMKIEAYEVLTRIVTQDRVIPAAEFIDTAKDMGVIARLDYQLMERAFDYAKRNGYNGKLFLNLSPKALIISEFMPTVRRLLSDYEIEPSKMVFEITERDTVKNMRLVERFVKELMSDGFRFAIDDFGAGYSSFQYIKTFCVDYVKIDGEFIRNMSEKGVVEKAIVSSIVSLSRGLGIKTIAEYVESEHILGEVDAAGIDFVQGFYVKTPSPEFLK